MYRRFDACSYACAIKQRAKRDTALWHQDRYSVVNNACPSCYSVGEKRIVWKWGKHTRVSRLLSLRRKSVSSDEVMRITFNFCTMTLANSKS